MLSFVLTAVISLLQSSAPHYHRNRFHHLTYLTTNMYKRSHDPLVYRCISELVFRTGILAFLEFRLRKRVHWHICSASGGRYIPISTAEA